MSNKILIQSNREYKTYDDYGWRVVSTVLPTKEQFQEEGMDDLSILDRKLTVFIQDMEYDGLLDNGKKFSSTIDLKKYIDIRSIKVK